MTDPSTPRSAGQSAPLPDEVATSIERLSHDGAAPDEVQALQQVWQLSELPPMTWDADAMAQRFDARLGREASLGGDSHRDVGPRSLHAWPMRQHHSATRRWTWLAGAALTLLIAAPIGLRQAGWWSGKSDATPRTTRVYSTTAGQRASFTLADGSHVTLAPQSKLAVRDGFGDETRAVELTGEAYFDVVTLAGAPFVVHTQGVTTRVLGTRFTVRRFADDTAVRVLVVSGKVMTRRAHADAGTTIAAQMMALVTDSATITTPVANPARLTGWTDGHLTFEDAPVPDVLASVGRWYGYTFKLTDTTLTRRHITVAFDNRPVESVLAQLRAVLGVTMSYQDTVITLHRRPLRSTTPAPARRTVSDSPFTLSELGR